MNSINSDEFNAVVSFNEDYFYFLRMINHGLLIPDYLFGDIIIPVDAAIDNIGLSLKQVLTKNKDGESEGYYIFDHELNKENYKENIVKLMRLCGYKNKKLLFKKMNKCLVRQVGNIIKIKSLNHIKLEAWDGDGISETDYVIIPVSASDEELGNAVIEAFSRCKGKQF
ncbi:contact-dependent growth inhibition system immunity protein [Morganella morganii]|nr:CdiI family contact-dependent growth inhibition immunity protein [Morganella morganii]